MSVTARSGPGLAQPRQVLAVEPVEFVGDVDLAVAAVLDPHAVPVIARHHLDERGVPTPRVPVAVPQAQRLAQPVTASSPSTVCMVAAHITGCSSLAACRIARISASV